MKELIKDLENCLIECRNPILSNMDQDCDRKTENDIVEAFKSIGLICCQELMDLYLWKTGCTKEFIFDLSILSKHLSPHTRSWFSPCHPHPCSRG